MRTLNQSFSLKRMIWAAPAVLAITLAADLAFFMIARDLGEQFPLPEDGNPLLLHPLQPAGMLLAAGVLVAAACALFAVFIRYLRAPATVFLSIAATFLVVSYGGPASLPDSVPLSTRCWLAGLHTLTAFSTTAGLIWFARQTKKTPLQRRGDET